MDHFGILLTAVCCVLAVLGVIQIITRKVTGKKIERYTEASVKRFAVVRGVIYLVCGVLGVYAAFTLRMAGGMMASLLIIGIALPIGLKPYILKEK